MTVRFLGGVAERRRRFAFGPAPTFKQDFVTGGGGALPQGATFSRGTIGTLYNQSGLVAYAPSNLLTYSQTFTNAAWSLGVTLNSNNNVAPDATLTAQQITFTASSGYLSQQYNTTQQSTAFTFSLFIRSDAPTTSQIQIQENGGVNNVAICNVTTLWQRFTVTYATSSAVTFIKTNILANSNTPTLYVWGAQLEQGSNATTYTPTTTAAVYGPRFDYDPGNMLQQNLLTYSNDFTNAIWSVGSPVSYTLIPGAITGPDGTASGTQITSVSGASATCRNFTATSTTATFSIYVKQGTTPTTTTNFLLRNNTTTGQLSAINLAGSGVSGTSSITSVGNGWYRVVLTATTGISIGDTLGLYYGATGSVVPGQYWYLYGGQLNEGSTALPYLATTSTAQTVCAPRGLLIEEARTNTMFPSQTISGWTLNGTGSVADNTLVSPDGATNASQITATAVGSGYWKPTTVTTATVYTGSLYLKAISGSSTILVGTDQGVAVAATLTFNMLTGAITSPSAGVTSSGATYVGNGWWRVWWTFTTNSTTSNILAYGSAGQVYGMYGAQSELGAFPTSYIPTTSATVTRNADNLSVSPYFFNGNIGSVSAIWDISTAASTAANRVIFSIGNSWLGLMYLNPTNYPVVTDALNYVSNTTTVAGIGPYKTAWSWNTSTMSLSANGATPVTGAFAGNFGTATFFAIGNSNNVQWYLNGHIRSLNYYNYALTNAQLQQVTT